MQVLHISSTKQQLDFYQQDQLFKSYSVSTARNGLGERENSECTPRGWHAIADLIGGQAPENAVFVARVWTGEIYSEALLQQHPERDWILTRILRLEGLEKGRNKGKGIDSFDRYIYIHGTPDKTALGRPGSRGCIRMNNSDIIELYQWVEKGTLIYIE